MGAALIVIALAVPACAKTDAATTDGEPAVVETAPNGGPATVTLKPEAAARIGLNTDVVRDADVDGVQRKVVPYSAVLYDPAGATYAYGTVTPLVFVRVPLVVDSVRGNLAVLTDGPPAGASVVTVGAPELFGVEFEVGE